MKYLFAFVLSAIGGFFGYQIMRPCHAQSYESLFVQVTWIGSSVIVGGQENAADCLVRIGAWNMGKWAMTSAHSGVYSEMLSNGDMVACVRYHVGLKLDHHPTAQELFDGTWAP